MQHTSLFTVMRVELCRNQLSICYKRLRRRSARRSHLFQLALWGLFSSQHNAGYNSPEVFLILIAARAPPSPTLTTAELPPPQKQPLAAPRRWDPRAGGHRCLRGAGGLSPKQGSTTAPDLLLESFPSGIVSARSSKPAALGSLA